MAQKRSKQQSISEAGARNFKGLKALPKHPAPKKGETAPPHIAGHLIPTEGGTISSRVAKRQRLINEPAADVAHDTTMRRSRRQAMKRRVDYTNLYSFPTSESEVSSPTDDEEEVVKVTLNARRARPCSNQTPQEAYRIPKTAPSKASGKKSGNPLRPGLIILKTNRDKHANHPDQHLPAQHLPEQHLSDQSRHQRTPDHAVLRLEALLDQLDEDDTQEAKALFELMRRNLGKGRENKEHIGALTRIFAPVKQRLSEEYDRLAKSVAQSKQIFDDVDMAGGIIIIDD